MGELSQMVMEALKAIQELKVLTIVGKVSVTNAFDSQQTQVHVDQNHKAMVTAIDLIQGDITTAMDGDYTPGKDSAVAQFHERQVKAGNEIITRNLNLLRDMAKEIIDIAKQEKGAGMP